MKCNTSVEGQLENYEILDYSSFRSAVARPTIKKKNLKFCIWNKTFKHKDKKKKRLHASFYRGHSFSPGQEAKLPHGTQCGQKEKSIGVGQFSSDQYLPNTSCEPDTTHQHEDPRTHVK